MGLGVAGVDMLQSDHGPLILEVNSSSPGSKALKPQLKKILPEAYSLCRAECVTYFRMKTHRPLNILDTEIKPGKQTILNLDIARLHTRTKVEVPVIIERGLEDGPVLLLNAGIHGNEVNGVEIIREVISRKINKPKRGTVHLYSGA